MFDFLNTDPFLVIVGCFYLAAGISVLLQPALWRGITDIFAGNAMVVVLSGFLPLIIGLIITTTHFGWNGIANSLLSVIGIVAIIEGLTMLFFPRLMQKFVRSPLYQGLVSVGGYLSVAIGSVLLFLK